MATVRRSALPRGALIGHYRDDGAYTDCYVLDVAGTVSQQAYVHAFYTSWLFKIERLIIAVAVRRPSTDAEAVAIAAGDTDRFSAWTVEARAADQLVMCDYQNRTRSWLMTVPLPNNGTRLYFGTAVAPQRPNGDSDRAFGIAFRLMLWFHKLYSHALLRAASRRV
jgi:hypothetical protein